MERLGDLEDELVNDLFIATREMVKILKKALNPDAFNIGINDGEAAGQEIPHLHVTHNIVLRMQEMQTADYKARAWQRQISQFPKTHKLRVVQ